uniref:Protein kinase domain-containing protein n=1 Tax=Vitis vinifera TaxID=29760 RepID=F6HFE5_VITVI
MGVARNDCDGDLYLMVAALLAFRDSVRGSTLIWNGTDTCSWEGIQCDADRVTSLRLPADDLTGNIPPNTLGNLTQLRDLSLRGNSLTGNLPSDLGSCTQLQRLFLQDNQFSGQIPAGLFLLNNLVRLDLSRNNLSGEISQGFGNLTKLRTLYLERNQLSGSIPDLNLELRDFNVSYNRLSGSIPKGLRNFGSDAFQGNSLCGSPLASCPDSGNKLSGGAIAGIVIASVIGLVLIIIVVLIFFRKYRRTTRSGPEFEIPSNQPVDMGENGGGINGFPAEKAANGVEKIRNANGLVFLGNGLSVFDLEELLRASAEVLGKGTCGTTYKAMVGEGVEVVVKRLRNICVYEREFLEEVARLGGMVHENLASIRAYYYGRDEKLLIYDCLPMGNLSSLLHGDRGAWRAPLSWEVRGRIALGAARGIKYLHSHGPNVSHGNIKSSNILLTNSCDALVTEFGIVQLVSVTSAPKHSGYCAPETRGSYTVSQKADVYSFGVVLLELLTAKAPTYALSNEEEMELPRWVESVVEERGTIDVFDLELLRYDNIEEQVVQLLHLALLCTSKHPKRRPSMAEVTRQIELIFGSGLPEYEPQPNQIEDGS